MSFVGIDAHIDPLGASIDEVGGTMWALVRLRCPVCALARTPALPTDRGTRLCSAVSATGGAEQRGPTKV